MYLLIHEDGTLQLAAIPDQDVFDAAENGLVNIVHIAGQVPLQYYKKEWHTIPSCCTLPFYLETE